MGRPEERLVEGTAAAAGVLHFAIASAAALVINGAAKLVEFVYAKEGLVIWDAVKRCLLFRVVLEVICCIELFIKWFILSL